jgi:hypothetical protein
MSTYLQTGTQTSNHRMAPGQYEAASCAPINTVQNGAVDAIGPFLNAEIDKPEEDPQYYGESSSTSFIQEMNETFSSKVGMDDNLSASAIVAHQGPFGVIKQGKNSVRGVSGITLGHDNSRFLVENLVLPSRSLCDHLLERYWINIYPLFHFIHKPTFMTGV